MSRILILTRGAPGVGKTTYLNNHGLYDFVVSPDQIRSDIGGVSELGDGYEMRGSFDERDVWLQVKNEISSKMKKGEPVIVDATFQQTLDFTLPLSIAKINKYEVIILDFTMVSQNQAIRQNAQRQGWKLVPEDVIAKAYKNFRKNSMPKGIKVIPYLKFTNTNEYRDLRN